MFKVSLVGAAVLLLSLGKALAQSSAAPSSGSTAAPSSGSSSGSSADPADDCKLSNDFKYEVCGSDSEYHYSGGSYTQGKTCCSTRQTCVGPVKIKQSSTDIDAYECSATRKLEGMKVLKIIFIPLIFIPLLIVFDVILVLKLDIKGNHLTKAATWLIGFSWPLLLSSMWFQGVWGAFLAFLVAFLSCCSGMPKWVYRLAWALQIFQIVLLLGPTETFHVPLFNQSLGSNGKLIHYQFGQSLDANEAACSTFYEDFFKKINIKLAEKESNPDNKYGGLCDIGWLGFIQFCLMMQVVTLIFMVLLSAPMFLDANLSGKKGAAASGETKVISVMPTGGGSQDAVDKVA
jgi:hypothetical protein